MNNTFGYRPRIEIHERLIVETIKKNVKGYTQAEETEVVDIDYDKIMSCGVTAEGGVVTGILRDEEKSAEQGESDVKLIKTKSGVKMKGLPDGNK